MLAQHKKILERTIPDVLKLSIARKIENNLFSKVGNFTCCMFFLGVFDSFPCIQISFLVGLGDMGEIRTHFTAEVYEQGALLVSAQILQSRIEVLSSISDVVAIKHQQCVRACTCVRACVRCAFV